MTINNSNPIKKKNSKAYDNLKTLIRELSLSRIKIHTKHTTFEIKPFSGPEGTSEQFVAFILLSGKALKLTLNVCYNFQDIIKYVANIIEKPEADITPAQCADFIKEFCNLTAGAIKKAIEEQGISGNISIPEIKSELIKPLEVSLEDSPDPTDEIIDSWVINSKEINLRCVCLVKIYDAKSIESLNLKSLTAENQDNGDVDFL